MTTPLSARLSGQPLTRVDGRLKVTGAALYAADNPVPDHLHAVLVCSTVSRAIVASMDTGIASSHPDVVSVITDFPGIDLPYDISQVNFFGQPLAVVVANTFEAATHGATLVSVQYTKEAQSTNLDDAAEAGREPSRMGPSYFRGDADTALRNAPVVVDRQYSIARHYHNPIEISATIASWDGDRLTVWDKVQGVHDCRAAYGRAFGLPAENIHVISPFVGGAFGNACATWPHQLLAAEVARQLRRPVKLSLTRPQMYAAIGYRPTSRQRLALGTDRDGRFLATVHESEIEVSRYGGYEDLPTEGTRLMYASPAYKSAASVVPLDTSEPTWMRGPGAVTGAFALECAIDEVAEQLRLDPMEVRFRNEPAVDQTNGTPFSTRRLTECFRRGADTFGWSRRSPTPGAVRDGDQLIGMGTASALYHTLRSASSATARVNADGTAEIFSAASDIGPGTYTAMTQLAADALGLPLDRVTFSLGDSNYPEAAAQYGSQVMASIGSSIEITASMLRDRIIRTAVLDPSSPLNGVRPEDIDIVDGRMELRGDPARGETYRDLLRRRGEPSIEASETYTPEDVSARYSTHAYGAVFAEVAVDELLGTVRVRRMYAVYDAGRIINPRMAHSQAIGGMVQGIGMALLESAEIDYRDGRLVNANLSDYLVPVNADVPVLDAAYLDARDDISNPIGVKGLGEVVMVGVPAAIANAVYNATGRRVNDLPITIESML